MTARTLARGASGLLLALAAATASAQLPFFGGDGDDKPTLAPLLREVTPAVVSITVEGRAQVMRAPLFNDPFFDDFFGFGTEPEIVPQRGAGSGVIVDAENGYVLTNHHVIANAETVAVSLADRRQFEAEIIGSDEGTDIALLRIEAANLTALELGDSDSLEVGDFVLAIGNPFGLGQTVTSGIVSALGRGGLNAESYEDFIQTDASINPGNSGGALVDLDGRLVGINSAIIAPGGGNVGIGFAVPSNMASGIMRQLLEHGEVQRGQLGIIRTEEELTPSLAAELGLDVDRGVIIAEVVPGTAAEEAGLQPGDVIVELDGEAINDFADLRNRVGLAPLGSTVEIGFIREGRRQTVEATIGRATASLGATIEQLSGAELRTVGPGDPQYDGVPGVLVASVDSGSPAYGYGLRAGDLIEGVNNRWRVRTVEELTEVLGRASGAFGLNLIRDGRRLFLIVR